MFRFPWGDMHSLNLGWFLQKFNELREDWATAEAGIDGALDAEIEKAEDALSDVFDARDAAAASATAAAGSASAANTSAAAAQNSATAAASSATLANNKATAAGLSEAAAAQSATQAGNSATSAAGSATTAATSASNAVNSAAAAGTNATAAAISAANAATSANDAVAAADRAEDVAESIPDDYTALSNKVAEISEESPNVFNGQFSHLRNTEWNNEKIINTAADTRPTLSIICSLRNDTTVISDTTPATYIATPGRYSFTRTATADGNNIFIYDSGSTINIGFAPICDIQAGETYTISFDIESTNPSVIGGFVVSKIQIELGSEATPYFPALTAVDYVAREEIDKTQLIIAPVLKEMIADTALVANDFRIVNNKLYRITAPVASGGTLTPGTNCAATSIGAVLKTLLS